MNDAQIGVLSLILEVSADPKPGNVDREHEFQDLKYEHFIISAISAYPTFEDCMARRGGIGLNFLNAVSRSYEVCKTNVHFGAFMLLIPLIWCGGDVRLVKRELERTTHQDSLHILSAFRICKPRVMDAGDFDLRNSEIESVIVERDLNLYRWLKRSPRENVVARELIEGYWRSLKGSRILMDFYEDGCLNDSIVYTYLHLLSSHLDPLVISEHGIDVARDVMLKAKDVLREFESGSIDSVREFDNYLLDRGINPGSIADLTCASIYLALKEGII
ncbi:MAG: triphosphoribosyl-dephospho-CoA synthase [Archaeoglobales archaeon]|nr:MAG: triphosphoribosyl-dephospho-CoA synthase [Archaeoglobales archaeon]